MLWRCLSLLTRWDTNISNPADIQVPVFYMSGDRDRREKSRQKYKTPRSILRQLCYHVYYHFITVVFGALANLAVS